MVSFCEYCFDCYKRNEMCDYCNQVYLNSADDGEVDGQMWMSCDRCDKWNHPTCEAEYGTDPAYQAAAVESIKLTKEEEAAADLNAEKEKTMVGSSSPANQAEEVVKPTESPVKESEVEEAPYYCIACREIIK